MPERIHALAFPADIALQSACLVPGLPSIWDSILAAFLIAPLLPLSLSLCLAPPPADCKVSCAVLHRQLCCAAPSAALCCHLHSQLCCAAPSAVLCCAVVSTVSWGNVAVGCDLSGAIGQCGECMIGRLTLPSVSYWFLSFNRRYYMCVKRSSIEARWLEVS